MPAAPRKRQPSSSGPPKLPHLVAAATSLDDARPANNTLGESAGQETPAKRKRRKQKDKKLAARLSADGAAESEPLTSPELGTGATGDDRALAPTSLSSSDPQQVEDGSLVIVPVTSASANADESAAPARGAVEPQASPSAPLPSEQTFRIPPILPHTSTPLPVLREHHQSVPGPPSQTSFDIPIHTTPKQPDSLALAEKIEGFSPATLPSDTRRITQETPDRSTGPATRSGGQSPTEAARRLLALSRNQTPAPSSLPTAQTSPVTSPIALQFSRVGSPSSAVSQEFVQTDSIDRSLPQFRRRPTGHDRVQANQERRRSRSRSRGRLEDPLLLSPERARRTIEADSNALQLDELEDEPTPGRAVSHRAGRRRPSSIEAERQAHARTLADLKSLLIVFVRILPSRKIQSYAKKLFGPIVRFIVKMAAKALHQRGLLASNLVYDLLVLIFKWIINLFFREIRPRGAHKIPQDGGIIFVGAPHHNQFLDPLLLLSEVRLSAGRRISFLIAEKSMKRAFVGFAARLMQSISVVRAADDAKAGKGKIFYDDNAKQHDHLILRGHGTTFTKDFEPRRQVQLPKVFDFAAAEVVEVIDDTTLKLKKAFSEKIHEAITTTEAAAASRGVPYKILPYIDQTKMYGKVYAKLKDGGCVGIFPEGGSHDRTDLLPLKAGVSIMALGALMSNKSLKLRIVPVGLNYFHAHRFRSRAVVEFGSPIEIPEAFVELFRQGGAEKREAIGKVMDLVFDGLKSVTVRAPDYETLMVVQACRRLYKPPGHQLTLGQVVELNRRFVAGYLKYKDEDKIKQLRSQVLDYNKQLQYLGLKDHQVERSNRPRWKSLILLAYRAGLLSAWTLLALPGIVLNAPMFIAASLISRKKAKEALAASTVKIEGRDVLATWKVLVSLGMAPVLYGTYVSISTYVASRYGVPPKYLIWTPFFAVIALPTVGYSALKFGEVGMDIWKSLRPLTVSLMPGNQRSIEQLRERRAALADALSRVIEEFGPQLFDDFDQRRIIPQAQPAPGSMDASSALRRSHSQSGVESRMLSHPMAWLDEKLFGWSQSKPSSLSRGLGDAAVDDDESSSSEQDGDDADYEEVIRYLNGMKSQPTTPGASSPTRSRSNSRRNSSHARSRSGFDLTKLDADDKKPEQSTLRQRSSKASKD